MYINCDIDEIMNDERDFQSTQCSLIWKLPLSILWYEFVGFLNISVPFVVLRLWVGPMIFCFAKYSMTSLRYKGLDVGRSSPESW
jgi:hypothetical protein